MMLTIASPRQLVFWIFHLPGRSEISNHPVDRLSGFVGACPSDRQLFTAENAEIRRDYVKGNAETLKTEIKW